MALPQFVDSPSGENMKTQVNVGKIAKHAKKGDIVLVDGKLLGSGKISFPVTVYTLSTTKAAREKIEKANGKVLKTSELKTKKGVRVMK